MSDVAAVSAQQAQQMLVFRSRNDAYALPMTDVKELVKQVSLNHVPKTDAHILGVCNLRGSVVPVVDLGLLLDEAEPTETVAQQYIVLRCSPLLALKVDQVEQVLDVEANTIKPAAEAGLRHAVISDVISAEDDSLIRVLSSEQLQQNARVKAPAEAAKSNSSGKQKASNATDSAPSEQNVSLLINFFIAGQQFAFPVEQVLEVIRPPKTLQPIADSQAGVTAFMPLRDRVIPLVHLGQLFELADEAQITPQSRVLVLALERRDSGKQIGVIVDRVQQINRVTETHIKAVPELLKQGGIDDAKAMAALDSKNNLAAVLDINLMTAKAPLNSVAREQDDDMTINAEINESTDGQQAIDQLVIFSLAGEEYGISISYAKEILRVPETLTEVPKAPSFIQGVMNLRGSVLPIMDMRKRFAITSGDSTNRQRIIVLNINGKRSGFIVDSVKEVRSVQNTDIEPAPQLSKEQAELIQDVVNLNEEKRLILLINGERLVTEQEQLALRSIEE